MIESSETRFVDANGLSIGFDVRGAGPPLVMLHGATSAGREDFAAQLPAFAREFRVFLPDARAHATTRWDVAGGWSADVLVEDLLAFVDALGLESFHLAGFSMGGLTALRFAARFPERLRTLVVAGVSTQREPRLSVARRLMEPDRIERDDPAWAARLAARHDPTQGPGSWRRLMTAIAADVADQAELRPVELRRIDAPALVAVGDRDQFVPVDHAWALKRQLPDARLFVAPGCPHEVMVRRAGLYNAACAGFYRDTAATAGLRSAVPHAASGAGSGGRSGRGSSGSGTSGSGTSGSGTSDSGTSGASA